MKRSLFVLLTVLLISPVVFSQTVTISGSVFGLMSEKVLLIKKASKNVSFEGPISGARITLTGPDPHTTETDITGSYSLTIKSLGVYKMAIEKMGYSALTVTLNYTDDGLKTYYPAVSFMLKKDDNTQNPLGEITINNGGKFTFIPGKASSKSSTGVSQSNQILLEKAGMINNSSAHNVINLRAAYAPPKAAVVATVVENSVILNKTDTVVSKQNIVSDPVLTILADTISSVDNLRNSIERSKQLLATLKPDDKSYAILEAQIKNAEGLLKQKEAVIKLQDEQLSESKKKLMFLTLFSVFAVLSVLLLLLFLFQRKKHLKILDEKNKNITKINTKLTSSIRYAATIQSNFFKEKSKLKKLFPKAFIFNQPKDMLSGDFYWFTEKDGNKIVVVADCTGHGVPGALLTMLGHSLLDDIVTVKGETQPSKILMALCQGVMSAFSREEELEYGMDISVLRTKEGSNEVTYSGITNGLYHCRREELTHLSVTPKTIGPELELTDLKDQSMLVMKGDCFFMLSDGFPDQFNENKEKPEKFNKYNNLKQSIVMKIMERTHSTPELDLEDNTLKMSGICTPENPPEFFNLFKDQIDMILTSKSKYELVFHLDYFNTASSKCLLDLFRKVSQSPNQSNITVTWVHAPDDDEMRESGVLYSELAGIDFMFKHAN